ncbi:MAG: hypothetical protein WCS30_00025 [Selenomonadaceae bacterium]
MTHTANINLNLPEDSDDLNQVPFNENFTKIDKIIKTRADYDKLVVTEDYAVSNDPLYILCDSMTAYSGSGAGHNLLDYAIVNAIVQVVSKCYDLTSDHNIIDNSYIHIKGRYGAVINQRNGINKIIFGNNCKCIFEDVEINRIQLPTGSAPGTIIILKNCILDPTMEALKSPSMVYLQGCYDYDGKPLISRFTMTPIIGTDLINEQSVTGMNGSYTMIRKDDMFNINGYIQKTQVNSSTDNIRIWFPNSFSGLQTILFTPINLSGISTTKALYVYGIMEDKNRAMYVYKAYQYSADVIKGDKLKISDMLAGDLLYFSFTTFAY